MANLKDTVLSDRIDTVLGERDGQRQRIEQLTRERDETRAQCARLIAVLDYVGYESELQNPETVTDDGYATLQHLRALRDAATAALTVLRLARGIPTVVSDPEHLEFMIRRLEDALTATTWTETP